MYPSQSCHILCLRVYKERTEKSQMGKFLWNRRVSVTAAEGARSRLRDLFRAVIRNQFTMPPWSF